MQIMLINLQLSTIFQLPPMILKQHEWGTEPHTMP